MVKPLFLIAAALLIILIGGGVLWPLFKAGYRRVWIGLVAGLVVATLGLYQGVGHPDALQASTDEVIAPPRTLEEAIAQLQQVLERDPQRLDGWVLLARTQSEMGKMEAAATSWERALQLAPEDPGLLLEAAQSRAWSHPQALFDDTAVQWLQQARDRSANNERAVWLLGVAHRQRGEITTALELWESLLPRLEPAAASALQEQITAARTEAGLPAPETTTTTVSIDTATPGVVIQLQLQEGLKNRPSAARDTVFIIARPVDGPPMPVAVQRHIASRLPPTIRLTDADSPMPTQKLSSLSEVEIIARLSASGLAARQDGDIESAPVRITLPTGQTVSLLLPAP